MLRIFRPEEEDTPSPRGASVTQREGTAQEPVPEDDEPVLLNFEEWFERLRPDPESPLRRARRIHANCQCPECRSALVFPLVLNDGRHDRAGEEIPGTSTLVGFHCEICSAEWPA